MAKHGPLKKPSMTQIPILLFLTDHAEVVLNYSAHGTSIGEGKYEFCYRNGGTYKDANYYKEWHHRNGDEEKPEWYHNDLAPDIPKNIASHRLMQSGWLREWPKKGHRTDGKDSDYRWAWYDHPYEITPEGREIAEAWRERYVKHAAAKAAKNKESERYAIVRSKSWRKRRQYGSLVRVVRETKKRLYVEVVERSADGYDENLHPHKRETYVDRSDVVMDNADPREYQALVIVESNHLEWLADLERQEQAEIDAIKERFDQRRDQNKYALEDEVREALARVRSGT